MSFPTECLVSKSLSSGSMLQELSKEGSMLQELSKETNEGALLNEEIPEPSKLWITAWRYAHMPQHAKANRKYIGPACQSMPNNHAFLICYNMPKRSPSRQALTRMPEHANAEICLCNDPHAKACQSKEPYARHCPACQSMPMQKTDFQ